MTNAELITKIRAEVERLKKEKFGFDDWLIGYETACDDLLSFLDTLQEQEVDFEQELYNRFGMVKDFTLGMRIAQCFYELGKNAK